MIVRALGRGLADRNVADRHRGADDLAAGNHRLQIRGRDRAVDTVAVQHVGNGGGHVLHGEIAVNDVFADAGEFDLRDALAGNKTPDTACRLILSVLLIALRAQSSDLLVVLLNLADVHCANLLFFNSGFHMGNIVYTIMVAYPPLICKKKRNRSQLFGSVTSFLWPILEKRNNKILSQRTDMGSVL